MSVEKIRGHIENALRDQKLTLHEVQTIVSKEDPFFGAAVSVGDNVERDEYRTIADFATLVGSEKDAGRLEVGPGVEAALQSWLRANKDEQTDPRGLEQAIYGFFALGFIGGVALAPFAGAPGFAVGFLVGGTIGAVEGALED